MASSSRYMIRENPRIFVDRKPLGRYFYRQEAH
jgi:hypothetical protein